tara:strand:- start:769 stop:951 length:183 start_codon:yes stop_codon:yes gene_type:complete
MFIIDEKILQETIIFYAGYKIRACTLRFSLWQDNYSVAEQQVVFISKQFKNVPFQEICLN